MVNIIFVAFYPSLSLGIKMLRKIMLPMLKSRNKSWKPECIGSFKMDWRILVFYPEPEARDKIY